MKRVLFVDDERSILDGFQRALRCRRSIWEMEFVMSGEEALRACEKGSFDVVVSDLRMPSMDGATLLGIIKETHPSTARIVLSGYSDVMLATRALSVAHRALSKPCDPMDLRDAIDRVCALQEMVGDSLVQSLVGGVSELPSLSATYSRLLRVLDCPRTTIDEIAKLIESDVAMSAKILQIANSAFFGIPQRVTNLRDASMYLGIATIKNLALSSEIFCVLRPDSGVSPAFYDGFQDHSCRVAAIAGALPIEPGLRDVTTLAAFLHDIGRLFLAWKMPKEFCSIIEQAKVRRAEAIDLELELLGTSHAEIGAYLLGIWGLPFVVSESIVQHHCPKPSSSPELDPAKALVCAELLAKQIELHPNDEDGKELEDSDRKALEDIGILANYPALRKRAADALARTAR